MKILILEDDRLLADLLETIIAGVYPTASISVTDKLGVATEQWLKHGADLMVIDWNLPDGSGLDLVKTVRKEDEITPLLMVSGRSDRDSVVAAAHYGINGYITKPFSVELVRQKLAVLINPEKITRDVELDLDRLLEASIDMVIQLPTSIDPASVLELMAQKQDLSPVRLVELWSGEVALVSRILDVANSASFQRSGEPVGNIRNAIGTIGLDMALQHALAMSLDVSGHLQDKRLAAKAKDFLDMVENVAREARQLAGDLRLDPSEFHSAGLLSRIGELAVLKVLQQFVDGGGKLVDEQIETALQKWPQAYGNRLKVQWRLPIQLRNLVGAVHMLTRDTTSESALVMRAAALRARGEQRSPECQRLIRRLGLDHDEKGRGDD
ncbi:response regulator receiver protein [Marinobacter lipolyticus SM19]|uniref:Response regulator receiver protein n=1 Tax=Marinobacter lipolyticus SM19 TaxID=1318628 RepID=R8B333_9GAMM|nr:response regulator [Marinobacter lipolyticus]EON92986.1 response regulator receiver protein [Marinobacter lipolyticus SM19]